jgi:WD40 repeat protein
MQLASGADDAFLLIWKPDGTVQQQINHAASISSVAWEPGGSRLVTGSGNIVSFFDAASGQLLAPVVQAHRGRVTSVTWSARDGHPVVSGASDMHAIIWKTTDYQPQGIFMRHTTPILSVACTGGATVASASLGGAIRVWNLDTLREVHGFYTDGNIAENTAAFSSAGVLAIGGNDGVVRVWEQSTTCQQAVIAGNEPQCTDAPRRVLAHKAAIRSLAWSSDGSMLASGGDDANVAIWDAGFTQKALLPHDAAIMALAFSPDQRWLAVATGTAVQIWQLG